MGTPIWPITDATLHEAASLLRRGGLVAFPTETVYGLGANALDAAAVAGIFTAKGRPSTNPVIVHVPDEAAARALAAEWPPAAVALAAAFWPGPLTLVLPKAPAVPSIVTAGGPTVAIRCPAHPVAVALLRACDRPLAAPSANRSTELSPTRAEHVRASLAGRIDAILDGGPCQGGIESTVVDVTTDPPRILRPGLITEPMLARVIGPLAGPPLTTTASSDPSIQSVPRSPGQMAKHYAPRTRLRLVESRAIADAMRAGEPGTVIMDLAPDPLAAAAELYARLHQLDTQGWQQIVIVSPPDQPEWAAIRDRLNRAANHA